ncbi:SMP-30/gluconolactonase/LRE family protein [Desertivirga xinjiangensis]|uniref:SMP-30/gluconolactonase/LRE family protein n=1 Tax=Desertivirga xinjiangensis TaxID=539206 RepID=UPI00210C8BBB|nr:SMP-30/gluconolactonase/LRE family protein [Pedobacter xinjiangensis]
MRILLTGLNFPEGPCFDRNGDIWLVEKEAGNLILISNSISRRYKVDGAPNGIAIDQNNLIWFCDSRQNSIRTFDPLLNLNTTIVNQIEGKSLKMPNDLAFDKLGNLLFTCPGDSLDDNTGYICCLGQDRSLAKIYAGMRYPNGLAFNTDQSKLFVAETGTHKIWQFDWDTEEKKLSNQILFAETGGPVGPDGIAFDDEENLYVAVYGSGQIKIWNPAGLQQPPIDAIGENPTNCAIDPSGLKGIIITEARKGFLVQQPLTKKGIV